MRSTRSILSVKYTPASPVAGRTVSGFLRYVHYRDHEQRGEQSRGAAGLIRYVAYRDQALPQGRLFTRDRVAGDRDRKELVRFVRRSLQSGVQANARAVYRFVLSPEDARGLELRVIARATMAQLEQDLGPDGLPPWIAAEHRNTAHPHIHIVMAARRQVSPGVFRGVQVTRQRLARMKSAMGMEIERQRGTRHSVRPLEDRLLEAARQAAGDRRQMLVKRLESETVSNKLAVHDPIRSRGNQHHSIVSRGSRLRSFFARVARINHQQLVHEAEREDRRRAEARRKREQEEREREVYG